MILVTVHRFFRKFVRNAELDKRGRSFLLYRELAVILSRCNILGKYVKMLTTGQLTAQIKPNTRHFAKKTQTKQQVRNLICKNQTFLRQVLSLIFDICVNKGLWHG